VSPPTHFWPYTPSEGLGEFLTGGNVPPIGECEFKMLPFGWTAMSVITTQFRTEEQRIG
jgi:hypothetical protein